MKFINLKKYMGIEFQETNPVTEIINNIKEKLLSRETVDSEKIDYYINFLLKGKYGKEKLNKLYEKINNSDDKYINDVIDFLYFMDDIEKELNDIKGSINKVPDKIKMAIHEQLELESRESLAEFEEFMNENLYT